MKRKRLKLVLFDIDGTLLDTHGLGREAFIQGLERVTGERDELKYLSFAGNTDRNVLDQVIAARELQLAEEDIQQVFREISIVLGELLRENPAREIPGARVFLERLAAEDVAMGLVTGNIRPCAYHKLGSVGFDRFFPFGGFGDEHADRAIIGRKALAAAQQAGIEAEGRTCLIGDTPFDIAAGRELGLPVIGVAAGKFEADILRKSGASLVVSDYTPMNQLVDWMEEAFG